MSSTYSSNLGTNLMGTGDQSGTWGNTTNFNLGTLMEQAIASYVTQQFSSADITLSIANGADAGGNTTPGTIYTAGTTSAPVSARNMYIECQGTSSGNNLIVPTNSKLYFVYNNISSGGGAITVKTASGTGVAVPVGQRVALVCNGTNIVPAINYLTGTGVFSSITNSSLTSGRVVYSTTGGLETDSANLTFNGTTLTVNTLNLTNALTTAYGGTGLSSYTAGDLPYYASGTALSKLGIGTSGQILTSTGSAPQWSTLSGVAVTTFSAGTTGLTPNTATSGAVTLGGTLATTNGGTGLTSFTANGVVYASSTSALSTGSTLVFDGNNLGLGTTPNAWTSGYSAFEFGAYGSLTSRSATNDTELSSNAYRNTSAAYIYKRNGTAQTFDMANGAFSWNIAPSGTAGNAITFTQAMTLDNSGNLLLGTTSNNGQLTIVNPGNKININVSGNTTSNGLADISVNRSGTASYSVGYAPNIQFNNSTTGSEAIFQSADGGFQWFSNPLGGGWSERMRLDSSGNLGLGVTPSAWLSSYRSIAVNYAGSAISSDAVDKMQIGSNFYRSATADTFAGTGYATLYQQSSGLHKWFTSTASGTAGSAITFSQAMTLDASGRLLVGATSTDSGAQFRFQYSGSSQNGLQLFDSTNTSGSVFTIFAYNTGSGNNNSGTIARNGTDNAIIVNGTSYLALGSAGSERARIDSNGNLGLGVTPSAWYVGSSWHAIQQVGGGAWSSYLFGGTNPNVLLSANLYWNTSAQSVYLTSNPASYYVQGNGTHNWQISSGTATAGSVASMTQAMTLDNSGNLIVGATSAGGVGFTVYSSGINRINVTGTTLSQYQYSSSSVGSITTDGANISYNAANALIFGTGGTNERARIDTIGNLLVGTTTYNPSSGGISFGDTSGLGGAGWGMITSATSTSSSYVGYFKNPNGAVGSIIVSGSSTAYNTASDYRLKENVQPMTGAMARVAALKPVTYTWKADGSAGEGFIAHELAEVCPQAVTGEKDAVNEDGSIKPQGIDTSFLVATLTAAIQELKAEFDAYKASHP